MSLDPPVYAYNNTHFSVAAPNFYSKNEENMQSAGAVQQDEQKLCTNHRLITGSLKFYPD
jgi:hypothetical protein